MITIVTQNVSSYRNGRPAGLPTIGSLAKNKLVGVITASNHWAATEYNSNNAWNVNFGSGNFGNNNKYNSNVVRAVAALREEEIESFVEAYDECCRNKRTSKECIRYSLDAVTDLPVLAAEVFSMIYHPSTSITFIVLRPKPREIFAAGFRDRIVQHWIILRLNDIIEQRFVSQGNVSYNCREGFGTLLAQKDIQRKMQKAGCGPDSYVGHYDIRSFFMSIDVELLWQRLEPFIQENYKWYQLPSGRVLDDKEVLLWLTKTVIFHRPQSNCEYRGDVALRELVNPSKMLTNRDDLVGMPIGNITSQILANFFLSFFDEWMLTRIHQLGFGALPWDVPAEQRDGVELASDHYLRFVDDYTLIGLPREVCKQLFREASVWLHDTLHLSLHDDKVYLQHITHGVKMIGAVICPNRIYISNRTKSHFCSSVRQLNDVSGRIVSAVRASHPSNGKPLVPVRRGMYRMLEELEHYIQSANSLLGLMRHLDTYAIRRYAFERAHRGKPYRRHLLYATCYTRSGYVSLRIRKPFTINRYFITINQQEYAHQTILSNPTRRSGGHTRPSTKHRALFHYSSFACFRRARRRAAAVC